MNLNQTPTLTTYVVIRWDLPWSGRRPAHAEGNWLRRQASWQAKRRELFERFTLPSLQAQTSTDWCALLLADRALEQYHKPVSDPRVRWIYGPPDLTADLDRRPSKMLQLQDGDEICRWERTLWVRMDSDDMLAPRALELMRSALESVGPGGWVQLMTGVAYHAPTETWLGWHNPSPPFYGQVADDLPLFGDHSRVAPAAASLGSHLPHWAVVLHDCNLLNALESPWCRPLPAPMAAAAARQFPHVARLGEVA